MKQVKTFSALKARERLVPHSFLWNELAADEVEVEVAYCAICHSDLHLLDDDWGISRFPLTPGHEIIGRVAALGGRVEGLKINDIVGIGWQRGACGACTECLGGQENLCAVGKERTCVDQPGGFADKVRARSAFVFKLPKELDPETSAPLLCAGLTVFSPLVRHKVGDGQKVAIIGLGGLGHLAVQFAAAMGAQVSVFDPVGSKAQEARQLGAVHFHELRGVDEIKQGTDRFDFILSTTHADLDWNCWLSMLKLNGTLCLTGVPQKPLMVDAGHLLDGQKCLTGSVIGSPQMMRNMLDFAAKHRIRPLVEVRSMSAVNEAIETVRAGQARYRMVLSAVAQKSP